jgi:hypothetical protein
VWLGASKQKKIGFCVAAKTSGIRSARPDGKETAQHSFHALGSAVTSRQLLCQLCAAEKSSPIMQAYSLPCSDT